MTICKGISFVKSRWASAILLWFSSCFLIIGQSSIPGQTALRPLDLNSITSTSFLKDSTYVFNELDDSWVLNSKHIYRYDVQGNEIERVYEEIENGTWLKRQRVEKAYDSAQLLFYERISDWNDKHSDWEFKIRKDFDYNAIGLVEEEIVHLRDRDVWLKNQKFEYTYNSNYLLNLLAEYEWIDESDIWQPVERTLFNYNGEDNINSEIIQIWNDSLGSWVNHISREYNYDDDDNLISTVRSNWSDQEENWINLSMIALFYNDKGQIQTSQQIQLGVGINEQISSQEASYDDEGNLGQVVHSHWNEEAGEWSPYQKNVHYWSMNITGNLSENKGEIDCNFMNPYVLGLSWNCSSLKEDVVYSVEVYDLMGRMHYSQTIEGGRRFRLDGPIPPGVYTVVIRGGIDLHTEKIIIKD